MERPVNQPKRFQWLNAFWPGLALVCLVVPALPIFGGCMFIQKPEPDPVPTAVPDVHVNPDIYKPVPVDPATVRHLTDTATTEPNLIPDYYEFVPGSAISGDMFSIQAWRLPADPKGAPYKLPLDKPVKVKLGGISCPIKTATRTERGWAEAKAVTENWLAGRRLQVDEDKKYPVTIDGRNVVQIIIKSEIRKMDKSGTVTKTEEDRPFNQLLVRAGYAFVNLVSPTSFDYKAWIIDEEYARGIRGEPSPAQQKNVPAGSPTPTPLPGAPVGLWSTGAFPPYPNIRPGPPAGKKVVAVIGAETPGKADKGETKTKVTVKQTATKAKVTVKQTVTKNQ